MSRWFAAPQSPRIVLGTSPGRWLPQRLTLAAHDLDRHLHVIGTSGSGKSKLITSMAVQLLRHRAVAVIDPHGDMMLDILGQLADSGFYAQPAAYDRLLLIEFGRPDRYLPWNVLDTPRYPPHVVANHLAEVCRRGWPALDGGAAPQFENTLKPAIVTLAANHRPLTDLTRLLTQRDFREELLAKVADVQTVEFFHERFDKWGREAPLMIESTLRRAFLLTFSPTLRYSLGQRDNPILDFRRLMDEGISVLFNLAGLDEETQRFVGALLTVGFEEAAISREDIPEATRQPYHLLIDEFSLFSATSEESLARVLSLARKYRLYLTLAHQTFSQLSARMLGALQNAIEIALRLGPLDAQLMAPRFTRVDFHRIKHEVADPTRIDATHPIYFSTQEQTLAVAQQLADLRPREALIKTADAPVQIRTIAVPPVRTAWETLQAVRERYADRLLVPAERVMPQVDQPVQAPRRPAIRPTEVITEP